MTFFPSDLIRYFLLGFEANEVHFMNSLTMICVNALKCQRIINDWTPFDNIHEAFVLIMIRKKQYDELIIGIERDLAFLETQ